MAYKDENGQVWKLEIKYEEAKKQFLTATYLKENDLTPYYASVRINETLSFAMLALSELISHQGGVMIVSAKIH